MKPPSKIPLNLESGFTLNGKISIEYDYIDESENLRGIKIYTDELIGEYINKIKKEETFYYGITDKCLYQALKRYSINGKIVAIMGSQVPLYESICIHYGGIPTTIEYQKIESSSDSLKTLTVDEFALNPKEFDCAFSISSFEHDGLGRYGDSINPQGDLEAMSRMKKIVKRNGLLFLSVPIGNDKIVWNMHRQYGHIRLPMLLKGWKILDIFHLNYSAWQPVFILQNTNSPGFKLQLYLFLMKNKILRKAK
jgi:hypothetical protein